MEYIIVRSKEVRLRDKDLEVIASPNFRRRYTFGVCFYIYFSGGIFVGRKDASNIPGKVGVLETSKM